ncbi:MAG: 7TM diverse intracellular signaling domain-containing protein [Bacteroidales bacterium]
MYRKLIFFTLLFLYTSLSASKVITLDNSFESVFLNPSIYYIEDQEQKLNVYDIERMDFSFFQHDIERYFFMNFKHSSIWCSFILKNNTQEVQTVYLSARKPLLYKLEYFHKLQDGSFEKKTSGISTLYKKWELPVLTPTNIIEINPLETKKIIFKLTNHGLEFSAPLYLESRSMFYKNIHYKVLINGILYGSIFFIIILNFFFAVQLNQRFYYNFVLYIISVLIFILSIDGILFKYIYPWSISLSEYVTYIVAYFIVILLLHFYSDSQKIKIYLPKIHRLIKYYNIGIIVIMLASLFYKSPPFIVSNIVVLLSIALYIFISIATYKNVQSILSKYMLYSNIFIAMGALILVLKNFGLFSEEIGYNSLKVGLFIQILFISYGLMSFYKHNNNEKFKQIIDQLTQLNILKDKVNNELEEKVAERTKELEIKNNQLVLANKQLGAERDIFETQRNIISKQKQETMDSIRYTHRLQRTLIQSEKILNTMISNYFILEIPKDIVSGDFYWVAKKNNKIYIAIADCTGHGVPAAFMSVIGIMYLNEIFHIHNIDQPNEILKKLSEKIKKSFKSTTENDESIKDGMDISVFSIDYDNLVVHYSGANHSVYVVRENELKILKGDRLAIGASNANVSYVNIEFNLKKGDTLYSFSDGFVDQFGWRTGKKFKYSGFRELLLEISELAIEAQKVVLAKTFANWKGDLDQVDDVLIFGIKI